MDARVSTHQTTLVCALAVFFACKSAPVKGPSFSVSCIAENEVCNGRDDDCDGQTDEDLGVETCGVGACTHQIAACVAGVVQTCVPAAATIESCNGQDDDCDGLIDDELGQLTCGVGACTRTVEACIDGAVQTCVGGTPGAEICDNLDNDCDGHVDEDLGLVTCGVGACQTTVVHCNAGVSVACVEGVPQTEICDNLDNDCDGHVDEDLGLTTCGVGACQRTVVNCNGGVSASCVAGAPQTEICDGVDNDCNTLVDDVATGAYTPLIVTGFNADVIVDSGAATSSTGAVLDGSDYVLYSHTVGLGFGGAGLPDSGAISAADRSYQMQLYTQNNVLLLPAGASGTLTLGTAAAYPGVSLLGFATEGSASYDVSLNFSDGTGISRVGLTMRDWFDPSNVVLGGFDRMGRVSNTADFLTVAPYLHAFDWPLTCVYRAKTLTSITVRNASLGTQRLAIFAVAVAG